jgi:GNAT superfamily N-acetyltransferase
MAAEHSNPDHSDPERSDPKDRNPVDTVLARLGPRWQDVDPLLPEPSFPVKGCEHEVTVTAPSGDPDPGAVACCAHWTGPAGSLDLCWGTARQYRLTARVAGPDVAGSLDRLLSAWRGHLAGQPDLAAPDTSAIVSWPSRDVAGVATLLHHGLQPLAVVAARPSSRLGAPAEIPDEIPDGIRIRRAGPDDLAAVVRLEHEVVRYDANFVAVIDRPWTAAALAAEAEPALAVPEPWVWLAERERDGEPVGVLHAQPPATAAWIAPLTSRAPVAYNLLTGVSATQRGGGIGAALATRFHRAAEAADVAVTLLHYAQLNPRSMPFWSQQGYRPLWTLWEAHPASSLR